MSLAVVKNNVTKDNDLFTKYFIEVNKGLEKQLASTKTQHIGVQQTAYALQCLIKNKLFNDNDINITLLKNYAKVVLNIDKSALDKDEIKKLKKILKSYFLEKTITTKHAKLNFITTTDKNIFNYNLTRQNKALLVSLKFVAILYLLDVDETNFNTIIYLYDIPAEKFKNYGVLLNKDINRTLLLNNSEKESNYLLFNNVKNTNNPIILRPSVNAVIKFLTKRNVNNNTVLFNYKQHIDTLYKHLHPDLAIPDDKDFNEMLKSLLVRIDWRLNQRK